MLAWVHSWIWGRTRYAVSKCVAGPSTPLTTATTNQVVPVPWQSPTICPSFPRRFQRCKGKNKAREGNMSKAALGMHIPLFRVSTALQKRQVMMISAAYDQGQWMIARLMAAFSSPPRPFLALTSSGMACVGLLELLRTKQQNRTTTTTTTDWLGMQPHRFVGPTVAPVHLNQPLHGPFW